LNHEEDTKRCLAFRTALPIKEPGLDAYAGWHGMPPELP
jgi:hypothetical protein